MYGVDTSNFEVTEIKLIYGESILYLIEFSIEGVNVYRINLYPDNGEYHDIVNLSTGKKIIANHER